MKPRSLQKARWIVTLSLISLTCLATLIVVMPSGARSRSKETVPAVNKVRAGYVKANSVGAATPAGLISVDSTAEAIANDGQCTLREAIINANDDAATWVDCETGNGTDTIVLATAGTYTLTVIDNGANGLPQITSAIVIQGNGSTIQRSNGAPRFRIFEVASTGDLTLEQLTVTGGRTADGTNGVVGVNNGNGTHGGDGGAIYNTGALTLIACIVSGNATGNGGHGFSATFGTAGGNGGFGGGIYNTGTLTLTNTTVSNNKVGDGGFAGSSSFGLGGFGPIGGRGGRGGGIYHASGTLDITGSTISINIAGNGGGGGAACNGCTGGPGGDGGFGGGVHMNGGTATLTNSELNNNRAGKSGDGGTAGHAGGSGFGGAGGAISQEAGTLNITNCTLDNNKAGDAGASSVGVTATPGGFGGPGGGIYSRATLSLTNSTVSNNVAGKGGRGSEGAFLGGLGLGGSGGGGGNGGGIYTDKDGTLTLVNSTISSNSAGLGGLGGNATGNCSPCSGGEGGFGGSGGGIDNAGSMILVNATLSHNSTGGGGEFGNPHTAGAIGVPGEGGGIHVKSGVGFPSTTIKIRNSIVAKNIDVRELRVGVMVVSPDVSGPFISLGHNFIGKNDDSSGFTDGINGDQVGTIAMPKDPLLGQLADNGGPTHTRNLQSTSTAMEAGDNCVLDQSCMSDNLNFDLTTDQRGLHRPQSNSVDIGSVEGVIGVPDAPDLLPASDSGSSQTDNLTNATNLQFEVTGAGAGATVVLLREGTVVATATADNNGIAALSYIDNSPDGTYDFTSRLSIMGALGGESGSLPVTIDRTRTNVTINQAGGQTDPTASLPINFTVVFNDPVSDFNSGDVSLTGSTANVSTATINITGGGTTYNVAIGNVTGEGTVQASVLENATLDAAGNSSTASTSGDNSVTRDITPPNVTINQGAGQTDPTSNLPINFTVVFSEPVTGFAETDVLLTGSTANISVATINVSGGGTNYNVAVGNLIGSGTLQVSIPSGAANDAAALGNTASTSIDRTVTYNLPPPSVTINQTVGQLDPTASLPINFTVVFNQPVTGFTNTGVSLAGSTANVSAATINVTGGGTTYNVAVGNVTSDGTVQASIPANVAVNVENAPNTASSSTDNIVTRDTTPTNLTVNTLGDAGDNVCDATCTLRDAIITAANPPGPRHILFNLPSCTAASPCTITLTRGELSIPSTSPVSIFGPGANVLTINGNNQSRLFVVNNAGLDLNDLKLTGGRAGNGGNDQAGGDGGAIYSNNGTLTLTNTVVTGNSAGTGGNGSDIDSTSAPGRPGGKGGNGGAIYSTGTLTLINSKVTGNSAGAGGKGGKHFCCPQGAGGAGGAGGDGGGVYSTGILTIINTTIGNNSAGTGGLGENSFSFSIPAPPGGAGGNGAGLYTTGPTTVTGSTFNNNNAGAGGTGELGIGPGGAGGQGGHGGAIYSSNSLVLTNSTFSANSTGLGGKGGDCGGGGSIPGGVGGNGGSGGAIYNVTGALNATNITVTGNTTRGGGIGGCGNAGCAPNGSPGVGGGLANGSGTAGTRNTIVAGNNPSGNGPDVSGAITSLGHNFIGKNDGSTGFTNGNNGDQVGTSAAPKDPLLGTLQENGGLTQTILPASNSDAIDAGDNCVGQVVHCGDANITQLTTDQRGSGFARIVNAKGTATVDIGAVEFSDIQQAQISFSNLIQTYDGTPKGITATTVPPGLTLVITYDGASTPPTNVKLDAGGNVVSYAVVATIQDNTYQGSASSSLTITKANQTITFDALSDKTFGDAPFAVSATASSGLPVSFSIVSGPASINGATVTLTGAGTVKVRASQAGNGNFNAASVIDRTFTVAPASQTINFGALSGKTFGDPPFVVSATGGASGQPVTFSSQTLDACSVNGSTVTILAAGTCTIRASQVGNDDYEAAPNVDQSFDVDKASQSISFGALPNKSFGDANFNVNATATSGLAVSFSANGQCTVTGNTVHLTGAGSCTITASQAGNNNYDAAEDVQQSFGIDKSDQTITFNPLPGKIFGDIDFSVNATASSGLSVSFSSSGNCSITGSTVHLTGAGNCTITASQAGDDNFDAAQDIQRSFNIAEAGQTITFAALSDKTFGDAPFMVSATASSGLPVSFSIRSGPATINGNTVTITGAGVVTVRASQDGDSNHAAAPHVERSFTVNRADQAITFNALSNKTFGDAPFTVTATGGASGNPVTFSASGNCTSGGTNGSTITITGAGNCSVTASQAGNTNYKAAADVNRSFSVNRANQIITFGALPNKTVGDAPFAVSATASSGLPVSFAAAGSCAVSGNTVTITGVGICTVTASQSGNSNYNSALPVSSLFNVLGTQGLATEVFSGVQTLRQSATDKQDRQKLDEVTKHLTKALDPTLWIDQTHLVPKRGETFFNETKDAIEKLRQLIKDKKSSIPDADIQLFIDRLLLAERLIAQTAINDAAALPQVNLKKLGDATRELLKGDADVADRKYGPASDNYREAWKRALEAMR